MNRLERKNKIEQLIGENKILEAIKFMLDFVRGTKEFEDELNQLIQKQGEFKRLEKEKVLGTIEKEKHDISLRKITYSLLFIKNELFRIPEDEEIEQIVIDQMAEIPEGDISRLIPGFNVVEEIVTRIGLKTLWEENPHLAFKTGDISYFAEQNFERWYLEVQLRARFIVLIKADKQRMRIPTQGDLSALSNEIERQMVELWRSK